MILFQSFADAFSFLHWNVTETLGIRGLWEKLIVRVVRAGLSVCE